MTASTAAWAGKYIERYRLALVEIPPGHKAPLHNGWNQPGGYVTDAAEARLRWGMFPDQGIGCVLAPSGLCSLDVDCPEHAEPLLHEFGIDLSELRKTTPTIQGNPARYRLMFKAPTVALQRKTLAWPANGEKPITLFELRAGDIQDVLCPTIHPETGKPYVWLVAPNSEFPPLPDALLELWLNWGSYQKELKGLCPWSKGFNPEPAPRGNGAMPNVIAAFNEAHDVESLLKAHGYKQSGKRWLSPTSSSGLAGAVILDDGRVYSHHASDPLNDGHSHDAFDVFRILDYAGDTRSAVKATAEVLGIVPTVGASGQKRREDGDGSKNALAGTGGGQEWPEPEPLPSELPEVEPFESELLPTAFRSWIEDIADRIQCAPDFPAVGAMVALAAVVGRKVGIKPKRKDDWGVIPNLWGGVVGRPGILKTPPLIEVKRPLDRLEIAAKEEHEEDVKNWQANQIIEKERAKVTAEEIRKRLKKGGDVNGLARDAVDSDSHVPQRRRYVVNDSSVEKIGETLSANPNGVLIFRDELTGFLRSLEREGQEAGRAFYLEAWNGTGRFTYDRIGRGTVDIEACCVSVLGGIQPGPLGEYLRGVARGGVGDDGLMQRFQSK